MQPDVYDGSDLGMHYFLNRCIHLCDQCLIYNLTPLHPSPGLVRDGEKNYTKHVKRCCKIPSPQEDYNRVYHAKADWFIYILALTEY